MTTPMMQFVRAASLVPVLFTGADRTEAARRLAEDGEVMWREHPDGRVEFVDPATAEPSGLLCHYPNVCGCCHELQHAGCVRWCGVCGEGICPGCYPEDYRGFPDKCRRCFDEKREPPLSPRMRRLLEERETQILEAVFGHLLGKQGGEPAAEADGPIIAKRAEQ